MAARIYTARIRRLILGFDTASLAVYEDIIRDVLREARDVRKFITDFEVTVPDEDEFTAALKSTHVMRILNMFVAQVNTDAWKYEISGILTNEQIQRLAAAA